MDTFVAYCSIWGSCKSSYARFGVAISVIEALLKKVFKN